MILQSSDTAAPAPDEANGETAIVVSSHIACCACCAPRETLPTETNLVASHTAFEASSGSPFAPSLATIRDVADYLRIGYWEYATGGEWTSGVAWDVSEDRIITFDVSNVSAAGANLARLAFDAWAGVVNLTFVEQAGGADITFSDAEEGAFSQFDAVLPTDDGTPYVALSAVVNIGRGWLVTHGDTPDSFGYQTYIHEIGHALGLGHAGPYNAETAFESDAVFSLDSWQMTVMSYFDQAEAGVGTFSELRTPMLADIIALDALYGLASHETGDTVYGFGATAANPVFDVAEAGARAAYTIHDTAGVDTLDYSGHDADQIINLQPLGISDVGGGRGNVLLGPETIIERVLTGPGDDLILLSPDTLYVDGGEGNDVADFSGFPGAIVLDLGAGSGGLTVRGIEMIIGTGRDDVIKGHGGSTTFIGGAGDDTIDGGAGADTISYVSAPGAVSVDLMAGTARDGEGGRDTLSGIRHIMGSDHADLLIGDDQGNRITGGTGDDTLRGGAGNDVLFSGLEPQSGPGGDNDILQGGTGNDVLYAVGGVDSAWGGSGDDRLFAASTDSSDRFFLYGGSGNDELIGSDVSDALFGGQGDDVVEAGDGDDEVFAGGGDDFVEGGRGADQLYGSSGADTIDGDAGHDLIFGGRGSDTLYGGVGNDALNGGGDDDTLYGWDGDDALYGSGGNDELDGGIGDDLLFGGAGDDALSGFHGDDELYGGAGDDGLGGGRGHDVLRGAAGDDILQGGLGNDTLIGGTGNDDIWSDEGDDTVFGGRGDDTLRGAQGNDTLRGQSGDDYLAAQAGDDLLNGGGGDDRLEGGPGRDVINGGAGDDLIEGGSGHDVLAGQAGRDTFVFNAHTIGHDRVVDFRAEDSIILEYFGYSGVADAAADFVQDGTSVVFDRGDVRVTFENANIGDVTAAISLFDTTAGSAAISIDRLAEPVDLADLPDWDSLL